MVLVTARLPPPRHCDQAGRCLPNAAAKQGLTAWLDATPDGANVYGPLGFKPTLQLRRLRLGIRKAARRRARYRPATSTP